MSYDYASKMLSYIKSGALSISYDDQPFLSIESKDNQRLVDIKSDIEEVLPVKNLILKINKIKKISSNLSDASITLVITEKGKPLVKLGEDAKPGLLSKLITGKNLEISKFGKKSNEKSE